MKTSTTELTYRQLQTALKPYRTAGFTNVKLNSKKEILVAEYNRLSNLNVTEQVTALGRVILVESPVNPEVTPDETPVTTEKTYENLDGETYNLVVKIAMERGYTRNEAETFANQLQVAAKKDYTVAYDKFLTRLMA